MVTVINEQQTNITQWKERKKEIMTEKKKKKNQFSKRDFDTKLSHEKKPYKYYTKTKHQ